MLDGILKEQELKEKMARLVELDALLNLDKRGVEEKQELHQEMQRDMANRTKARLHSAKGEEYSR